MIDEDIILELSDILAELTYNLNKPEYLIKKLYGSIG